MDIYQYAYELSTETGRAFYLLVIGAGKPTLGSIPTVTVGRVEITEAQYNDMEFVEALNLTPSTTMPIVTTRAEAEDLVKSFAGIPLRVTVKNELVPVGTDDAMIPCRVTYDWNGHKLVNPFYDPI